MALDAQSKSHRAESAAAARSLQGHTLRLPATARAPRPLPTVFERESESPTSTHTREDVPANQVLSHARTILQQRKVHLLNALQLSTKRQV
jgi:hypothetical protein